MEKIRFLFSIDKIYISMQGKIGVLLVNLGTPDSPKTKDVRSYLFQFLTALSTKSVDKQLLANRHRGGIFRRLIAGGSSVMLKT